MSTASSPPGPSNKHVSLVSRYQSHLPGRDFEGHRHNVLCLILNIPENGGGQGMGRSRTGREKGIPEKSWVRMAGKSQTTGR